MARAATQEARAPSRPARPRARKAAPARANGLTIADMAELETLRAQLARPAGKGATSLRWNADPDDVRRSVVRLVLTLTEFVRKLLERQAIRRMEAGTLTDAQTEDLGRALMTLEATIRDLTLQFDLQPEDLNLDLGPLGRLI